MTLFQVERRPDAQRTLVRLIVSFAPIFTYIELMIGSRSRQWASAARHDLDPLIQFEQAVAAGLSLTAVGLGVLAFVSWQTYARNTLFDESGLAWLSLHGWDGEPEKLPQRGLLPLTELIGIVVVSLLCARFAPSAIVVLPLCWSFARSSPYWQWTTGTRPWAWGTLWMLYATAIWSSAHWWLALPLATAAILLAEMLALDALRRSAAALWTRDLAISSKSSRSNQDPSPRRSQAPTPLPARVFPLSQIGVIPFEKQPTWQRSLWTACVVSWTIYCLTDSTVQYGKWTNPQGTEISVSTIIGFFGLGGILIFELYQTLKQFAPHVWQPRISLYSRLRTLRPIIWSWDRLLAPHAISATLLSLAAPWAILIPPAGFAALALAIVLILQQGKPDPTEWQMTSEARLNPSHLANLHYTPDHE